MSRSRQRVAANRRPTGRPVQCAAAVIAVLFAAAVASASTYTVTNTNDSGAGSLRQAVLDANANAVAIEHITLENEGWERDQSVKESLEPSSKKS